MGLIQWFRDKFRKQEDTSEYEEYIPDIIAPDRSEINMSDREMRDRYVRNCCDQMLEATKEIDQATMEYRMVTDYLNDMEEIDALPPERFRSLKNVAEHVMRLESDRQEHSGKLGKISNEKYDAMEAISGDMPDACSSMKEHEDYKYLVKGDLQKLEGEKASYAFTRHELLLKQINCRNMVYITVFAVSFTFLMLLVFQYVFRMNTMIGYIITAALAAIVLTVIFSSYIDSSRELKRAGNFLNQVIAKQNTVKIRYVNIENLLEYEYTKYHVNSSDELEYYWNLYIAERKERELLESAGTELSEVQERYMSELKSMRLKYPAIWLHQAFAIVDSREMVEIRHDLIARRQSLRKRIEYNTKNRELAKDEVSDLVKKYPNYGKEILGIVSEYE